MSYDARVLPILLLRVQWLTVAAPATEDGLIDSVRLSTLLSHAGS